MLFCVIDAGSASVENQGPLFILSSNWLLSTRFSGCKNILWASLMFRRYPLAPLTTSKVPARAWTQTNQFPYLDESLDALSAKLVHELGGREQRNETKCSTSVQTTHGTASRSLEEWQLLCFRISSEITALSIPTWQFKRSS